MELNTVTLSDFTKLADVIFFKGANSVMNNMRDSGLIKEVAISEHTGNTREFSEIDSNEYLTYKGESDQAARAQVEQGYTNTMTAYRVAENIGISYEMRTRNKYPEVVARLLNGGRKGPNTIDLDLSHRIGFGTATAYTDRDGRSIDVTTGASTSQQLFDTNHPLRGSSTTYRNRLANNPRISKGAIEGMERLVVEETYNHLGENMNIPYDILFTTADPNSCNTAREYLKSTGAPEAAHEGVTNVYQGTYKHVKLPRIAFDANGVRDTAKRYFWGLASSLLSNLYLGIWEAPHMIAPTAGSNGEDVQTDEKSSLSRETLIEKLLKFGEHLKNIFKTIPSQAYFMVGRCRDLTGSIRKDEEKVRTLWRHREWSRNIFTLLKYVYAY